MNAKEAFEAHKEAIQGLGYCADQLTDKLCKLQLAVMMLAQKTGFDAIVLMKEAERVYDV